MSLGLARARVRTSAKALVKAPARVIAFVAGSDAADARFTADAWMQLVNSSWALVSRRKGEEGQSFATVLSEEL
jgi:hypothetical protein